MTGQASQFVGAIPARYDADLGPIIFADYAADMGERVAALAPKGVLELAAGTGIVSRRLRDALAEATLLTVTDLNAPMLDVARRKFRPEENVRFETANAMALPFGDAVFDLAVCQFGVMFFPDKVTSFREARRVLAKGGRYIFNAWGSHAQNPFARIAQETVTALFPENTPGFYNVPFSYADPRAVVADLQAAGFSDVAHETITLQKQVPDVRAFTHGLVFGNPLSQEIRERGGDPAKVAAAVEARFRANFGGEPATMPLVATVYSAVRSS